MSKATGMQMCVSRLMMPAVVRWLLVEVSCLQQTLKAHVNPAFGMKQVNSESATFVSCIGSAVVHSSCAAF